MTNRRGIIRSPTLNATSLYPANTTCKWVVEARPGRIMKLEFSNLDIPSSDNLCHDDYLTVIRFMLLSIAFNKHTYRSIFQDFIYLILHNFKASKWRTSNLSIDVNKSYSRRSSKWKDLSKYSSKYEKYKLKSTLFKFC